MSDTKRQGEVEAMATALSIAFANPALEPVLKQALLALWSMGESVVDVRALLAGKKVPIMKNNENWQLQLSNLSKLGKGEEEDTHSKSYVSPLCYFYLFKDNVTTLKKSSCVEKSSQLHPDTARLISEQCPLSLSPVRRHQIEYVFL